MLFASGTSAGIVLSDKATAASAEYAGYYHSARRVIQLADGSDLILYEPLPRDRRGHSGVFLLQQEPKSGYWRVKSWFEVPGASPGDIAFSPDDTLLLLAQKGRAEGGPAPILTIFPYSGQNLGAATCERL